jgi:lysylphosphatidylglycerol synthetase-like protein (DUF2156 family)
MIYYVDSQHGSAQAAFIQDAAYGNLEGQSMREVRRARRRADEDAYALIMLDKVPGESSANETGASSNQDHIQERL